MNSTKRNQCKEPNSSRGAKDTTAGPTIPPFPARFLFLVVRKRKPNKEEKLCKIRRLLELCQTKEQVDDRNTTGTTAFLAAFWNEKDPACLLAIIDSFWNKYMDLGCDPKEVLLKAYGDEGDSHCGPFHGAISSKDEAVMRRVLSFYLRAGFFETDISKIYEFHAIVNSKAYPWCKWGKVKEQTHRILEAFVKENRLATIDYFIRHVHNPNKNLNLEIWQDAESIETTARIDKPAAAQDSAISPLETSPFKSSHECFTI